MTAVDRMLDALREAAREAREERERAEAYQAALDDALTAITKGMEPSLVERVLRAQILGAQRALDVINGIGRSK